MFYSTIMKIDSIDRLRDIRDALLVEQGINPTRQGEQAIKVVVERQGITAINIILLEVPQRVVNIFGTCYGLITLQHLVHVAISVTLCIIGIGS